MNPSTSTKFALLQKLLFNRLIYTSRAASFLPNDVIEEPSLHEEIPQKEPKYVHEMVGRKCLTRAVYGAGALAVERLLIQPSLKQWGQNEYSQMCSITDEPQIFLPQHVPFKLVKIVGAEATGVSCIVCNSDGQVFTWGSHILGFGSKFDEANQIDPPLFTSAINEKNSVVKVFAGGSCMGALTEAGHLFTWGSNKHGVLALAHRNHQYFPSIFSIIIFQRSFHSGENKPKGLFQNFKHLFKRYWYFALPIHCLLSLFWFFLCFSAIHLGLDFVSLLEFLRLPESWIQKVRDLPKSAGTLTVALILYKALTPIRYSSTLFCTYKIVKLLRKK